MGIPLQPDIEADNSCFDKVRIFFLILLPSPLKWIWKNWSKVLGHTRLPLEIPKSLFQRLLTAGDWMGNVSDSDLHIAHMLRPRGKGPYRAFKVQTWNMSLVFNYLCYLIIIIQIRFHFWMFGFLNWLIRNNWTNLSFVGIMTCE